MLITPVRCETTSPLGPVATTYPRKYSQYSVEPEYSIIENKTCQSVFLYERSNNIYALINYYHESNNDSWINQLYNTTNENRKLMLKLLYTKLDQLLSNNHYQKCNSIFNKIRFDKLAPSLIIGLLRFTYTARHKLPNWKNSVYNAKNILDNLGLDSNDILDGLLDDE